MEPNEKPGVFISYSRTDGQELASQLEKDLKKNGYKAWRDTSGIPGGAVWERIIERAIEDHELFIVVLTPNSVEGDSFCRNEISRAKKLRHPILPLMAERCTPPILVENLSCLDFLGWKDPYQYQQCLGELLKEIILLSGDTDTNSPRLPVDKWPRRIAVTPDSVLPRKSIRDRISDAFHSLYRRLHAKATDSYPATPPRSSLSRLPDEEGQAPRPAAKSVFISHATEADGDTAHWICEQLETRHGIKCWLAQRDLRAGQLWGEEILNAMEQGSILLLILSRHTKNSIWVPKEVLAACTNRLTIIVFRLEKIDAPKNIQLYVSDSHWLDAFDCSPEESVDKLAAEIGSSASPSDVETRGSPSDTEDSERPWGPIWFIRRARKNPISLILPAILICGSLLLAYIRPWHAPEQPVQTVDGCQVIKQHPTRSDLADRLIQAAGSGQFKAACDLLQKGAEVDGKDARGRTALMMASKWGYSRVIRLLLAYEANANLKDMEGCTALMYAMHRSQHEASSLLLEHGAYVNAKNSEGQSVLHIACDMSGCPMALALIGKGADVNAQDSKGRTPLMYAASIERNDYCVGLLVQNGADPYVKEENGKTALDLAREKGFDESARVIIKAMIDRKEQ